MGPEISTPKPANPLTRKAKTPRKAFTFRGARRNAAREMGPQLDAISPYKNWRKRWTWFNLGPATVKVLRGKPKFARNVLGEETIVGFHPDQPRPSKSKLYSYAGKR